jgi:DNA-binding CsgD family transcriptional regulator
VDRCSLSFIPRPNARVGSLPNTLQGIAVRTTIPAPSVKKISAAEANDSLTRKRVPPPKSAAGFLLLDSSLNPISFNAEAIQILGYPDDPASIRSSGLLLTGKVRTSLISQQPSGESPFVTEFRSGRRHYFCRTFLVRSHAKDPSLPSIVVILERGLSGFVSLSQVSQKFNFTQREREVLEYLLQGLNSKAIANRMNISPNTVNAFLRLIMIKTGVSSRSAVVGKIIMT